MGDSDVFFLEGTLEQERDIRRLLHEECGLAGAVNLLDASEYVFEIMASLEHRGEKAAGIVSTDGKIYQHKGPGRARNVFHEYDFRKLQGKIAIGQDRYATAGDPDSFSNIQPLVFDTKYGPLAIAHNGTFFNASDIRKDMITRHAFQSTSDSELFVQLIVESGAHTIEEAIIEATKTIPAAYSFLFITPEKIIAMKDPHGIRPLSFARLGDGYLISSEDYVFLQIEGAEKVREINPGEMIVFNIDGTYNPIQYADQSPRPCVFELIYFSNPMSTYEGVYVMDFRRELGRQLFLENAELSADEIVAILDSGKHAALGLHDASGIPYLEAFLRHQNPLNSGRSFTAPTYGERYSIAKKKLLLREDFIRGKEIVLTDDSIVRSITSQININRVREAGATSVKLAVSAPPIRRPCPFGMDFHTEKELVAYQKSIPEIARHIGADRLYYLSLSGLDEVIARTIGGNTCKACFNEEYPPLVQEYMDRHRR
ncbi:amidophosphoribosyltransferase [Candidatus Woesearchaeota archaeon]|nr:amidophosphoribosyltransferase [Candidatus Woesearchaeota archaeon]